MGIPEDLKYLRGAGRLLWAAVGLGLALRVLIKLWRIDFHDPELFENGDIALLLLTTGQYAFDHPGLPTAFVPPGFTLLIAAAYAVFGTGPGAGIALAALLFPFEAVTPFLVAAVARVLWGDRVARRALVLALFWPGLLLVGGRLHAISIYQPLLVALVWVAATGSWSPARRAVLAGVILGVFVTLRFDAPIYLLPLALLLAPRDPARWRPLRPLSRTLGLTAVAAALLLAGASPWLIRNRAQFGEIVYSTQGGYNLLRGHHPGATGSARNPWSPTGNHDLGTPIAAVDSIKAALAWTDPADEVRANDAYFRAAWAYARTHPREELVLTARKALYFLVADFTHPVARRPVVWIPGLLGLGIAVVFLLRTRPADPRQHILILVFLMQLGMAVVFHVVPRYRILVDWIPLLFVAAASVRWGWVSRLDGLLRSSRPPRPRPS